VEIIVTAFATIGGVLVGSATTYRLEKKRRLHDAKMSFRNERKSVYANFLTAVVVWQNEIGWLWKKRFEANADEQEVSHGTRKIQESHQATMAPLFELRMVGSENVVEAAEAIISFVYRYAEAHSKSKVDSQNLEREWVTHRNLFISQVRSEIRDEEIFSS
jgi:hypothetical protein